MKRILLIVVILVCLGGGALWYFQFSSRAGAALPAQSQLTVQRANLEDVVTALGKLEPATYVDVGAQISGQLQVLHVELGSVVKKGDLLAEIDPRTYRAKVEADQATIANLEATLAERRATLQHKQRIYQRDKELFQQNATSEVTLQSSETEYRVAQAQVDAVQAQLRQARAQLESDELNLSYTAIYAPLSGTVVDLPVKEGQTINSSQTAPTLMRIAELEIMTVWASVSEADINKLKPGMPVYFTTIGDTSTRYYAHVDKIQPSYTEDNDVILYDVVFNVENPNGVFLPAMNTQVFFVLAQATNALTLPIEILPQSQRSAGSVTLTVMGANGKEEQREVILGVRTRTAVEILSGLAEGDVVTVNSSAPAARNGGNPMRTGMGPRI